MITPRHPDGTPMTIREYFARRDARKAQRMEKGLALGLRVPKPQKFKSIAAVSSKGEIKKAIVSLLGLLDKKKRGPFCRLGALCPKFRRIGAHHGEVPYHIEPQQRGDAARFVPENVVWACSAANFGEVNNRKLYRDVHIAVFGIELVERLEAIARTTVKYSRADLLELREKIKNLLTSESAVG